MVALKSVEKIQVCLKSDKIKGTAHAYLHIFDTGQQNLTFFFVPRTSIDELSSTFYAELRYVYNVFFFLSGRVSKIQRNLNVQNSTLHAQETGRSFSLKCTVV